MAQPLFGTILLMLYMLMILKTAPFKSEVNDWASFISSLTMTTCYLFAFVLSVDKDELFNPGSIGVFLITISLISIIIQVVLVFYCTPAIQSVWSVRCAHLSCKPIVIAVERFAAEAEGKGRSTAVAPATPNASTREVAAGQAGEGQRLRNWGKTS